MRKFTFVLAALISMVTISGTALATSEIQHSGGTNEYGYHNDHIHGGYHCH